MSNPVRVDVHTHLFNSNDIPIKGFISRVDIPYVPRWAERRIMALLGYLADKYFDYTTDSDEAFLEGVGAVNTIDEERVMKVLEEDPWIKEWIETANKELFSSESDLSADERKDVLDWLELDVEFEQQSEGLIDWGTVGFWALKKLTRKWTKRIMNWFKVLKMSHEDVADKLLSTYPDIHLFISPMMDMDKWLPGPDSDNSLEERIDIMSKLMISRGGRIHAMLPFDPRRAVEEGGDVAVKRVKTAIEEKGFVGVKLYPPMGFRASRNSDTRPALDSPEQYDSVLKKLFDYCVSKDVPITAHCTPAGAEADPSRDSGRNADPAYWSDTLERYPALRLNLAHFGGTKQLLSSEANGSWTKKIVELMSKHNGLYADCGHHGINKKSTVRKTTKALRRLYGDFNLEDRYMYGSDWHMIVRQGKEGKFPKKYVGIISKLGRPNQSDAHDKFFGDNAMSFLGLQSGGAGRARLLAFYEQNGMGQPEWVTLSGS